MSYSTPYRPEHTAMARDLVRQTQRSDGLAPVDLDRFWTDQAEALRDPFGKDIPQVPFGAILTGECVYDELGIPVDMWRYEHDHAWRLSVNKAYNDKAEHIVGRRILSEDLFDPDRQYPKTKGLHDVFEAENVWRDQSWWLQQSVHTPDELESLLDRVERRDIRGFILPAGWDREKKRLRAMGVEPPLYRGQRGPVTFATSIYGPENLIFLIIERPDLARRFSKAIRDTMLEIARVLDEEAGYTPESAPRGFSFCDDNCCLLTPDMYELFGYPVLEALFARYSPDPRDLRYQHSDSAMGHLLPLLGRLRLNAVNFGPTVMPAEIRQHLPQAVIYGQLAPFTYSRNEEENIVLEFLRDFDMIRETRGLVFATAGSINNGTRLASMRLAMAAIQRFGRY
ncbi:MAG TPA: uroporphyrinogen decarboxylase family protein [Candidatus Hydrogenedentes bacterium]|nr:uroporphyrinogen decarboxylase family protein [Candidatus Hydrogenedentota bacterium]HOV74561.1 uroporphyrinogen decarboxylase family protein [Candidatus Hydrogenedentota bacterium]HPC16959.1 uroporphyrinogen decarboxylase family protein [Candidatus Hydrogenedentota bacterium]HRT20902.1 uroporphyrinogen decarboxylase family protein [Candidatus Hydrogenedentota bacterium]HRT66220.1 uroporphyrinogen decarboxylase family protein [Candidatus Hydrogenedentota bacterium]